MDSPIALCIKWNQMLIEGSLNLLTDEQGDARDGECNCARWMAGHIGVARRLIMSLIGTDMVKMEGADYFNIGASGEIEEAWPSLDQIKNDLDETAEVMVSAFNELNDDVLSQESPFIVTKESVTVEHNVLFLVKHEAYHIGQIELIARSFGHPGRA